MSKIYTSVAELVGNTPLVELKSFSYGARVLAKLEYFNPAGSAKDRIAKKILDEAEKEGKLKHGSMIIEPTSGNTGIGLAALSSSRGYRVVLTMPETMSRERIKLLAAYGAEIVLTDGKKGMSGAIEKAEELHKENPESFIPGQFVNPNNPLAHYETTGPEIWRDCDGKIDFFVAGVGTGGTLSGAGKYLKEKNPDIKIVAVEPLSSPLLSKGISGSHGLMGIGANFVPDTLDRKIIDEVIAVSEEEAYSAGRRLAKSEGILAGITSGAALYAAELISKRAENAGKTIAVLLPDTGERYLSTPMFEY